METLLKDIRYGIRSLVRNPGFTAVAVITLALGIGANTAIFSVVNAVLLRPLPFDQPESIIWLWDTQPQLATAPSSVPDFLDWKAQNNSFAQLAAFQSGMMFVDTGDGTVDTEVGLVTPDAFSLFHVSPILGRTFTEEETLPERFRVAVLSQSLWQKNYGSDPNVREGKLTLREFLLRRAFEEMVEPFGRLVRQTAQQRRKRNSRSVSFPSRTIRTTNKTKCWKASGPTPAAARSGADAANRNASRRPRPPRISFPCLASSRSSAAASCRTKTNRARNA